MHDVIIVASLIEKETAKASESPSIAAVIYNRLCSKLYPCLEIDATIQYALDERKEVLSNADKGIISPYNTYKNAGLPAGPISNPGIASIRAALYPAESDDYFYALGNDGVHHFSRTYYEHQDFLEPERGRYDYADTADETAPDAVQTDETAAGGEAGGSDEEHADALSCSPRRATWKNSDGRGLWGGRGVSRGDELRHAFVRGKLHAGRAAEGCGAGARARRPRPCDGQHDAAQRRSGAAPGLSGNSCRTRVWTH